MSMSLTLRFGTTVCFRLHMFYTLFQGENISCNCSCAGFDQDLKTIRTFSRLLPLTPRSVRRKTWASLLRRTCSTSSSRACGLPPRFHWCSPGAFPGQTGRLDGENLTLPPFIVCTIDCFPVYALGVCLVLFLFLPFLPRIQ